MIRAITEEVLRRLPKPAAVSPIPPGPDAAHQRFGSPAECDVLIEFHAAGECSIEPGKPCIRSSRCRELGH